MMNRKRYYNSFFEQIQEYKQEKGSEDFQGLFNNNHHILGAGVFAAFLSFFVFGGYFNQFLPEQNVSDLAAYIRTDNRLAADVFRVDRSSADVGAVTVPGTEVFPLDDGVVDAARVKSSDGERPYLELSQTKSGYLKFTFPESKPEDVLKLYLWVESGDGNSIQLGWTEDVNWSESLLTYESAPEAVTLDIEPVFDETTGAYVFDITEYASGARAFALKVNATSNTVIYARESSTRSPRLSVMN